MLKTPPGITHRKNPSKALSEAAAVFEALYKKHFSSDIDSLQREAEDYLIRSLYKSAVAKGKEEKQGDESLPPVRGVSKVHINYSDNTEQETDLEHRSTPRKVTDKKVSIDTRETLHDSGDREESDIEEEPVRLKIEAIPCSEGHVEGTDISPTHYPTRPSTLSSRLSRRSTLRIPSSLKTISFYCLAIQFISSLVLGAIFYILMRYEAKQYTKIITIVYPFVVHIVLYIIIFSLSDKKLKGTFLLYSSDISIAVLRRKLVRAETYNNLNKVNIIIERSFVLVCLIISCLPCDFSLEGSEYSFFEYSYIIALCNLFGLYLMITYFYFYIIFNKVIKRSVLSV